MFNSEYLHWDFPYELLSFRLHIISRRNLFCDGNLVIFLDSKVIVKLYFLMKVIMKMAVGGDVKPYFGKNLPMFRGIQPRS